jgi:hypothetical protein
MQDAGCRMQDAGCRMQDAGCRIIKWEITYKKLKTRLGFRTEKTKIVLPPEPAIKRMKCHNAEGK